MADAALVVLLVAVVATAVVIVRRRSRKGSACCGPAVATPARVRVADRNAAHYPHAMRLSLGGMTCTNCAIKVENALNALPGTWATVDYGTREALVRSKGEPDVELLRHAVSDAGYVVLDLREA